jgi:hypothetical protein
LPRKRSVTFSSSQVVGHDQVRVQASRSAETSTPAAREIVQLAEQHRWIDDDAVGDHVRDVGIQDARGHEVELEQPTLGDDRVARVVPA